MSDLPGGDAQPIGGHLDALGITATIADDELLAGALVILKVVQPDGYVRLSVSTSEGLGWIERAGMLSAAHALDTASVTGRLAGGA